MLPVGFSARAARRIRFQAATAPGRSSQSNSPGASHYTHAELYDMDDEDDMADFASECARLEGAPEWIETNDECAE